MKESEQKYIVCEEAMAGTAPSLEVRLLEDWLDSELKFLQENAKETSPDPKTFIAKVRSEICNKYETGTGE